MNKKNTKLKQIFTEVALILSATVSKKELYRKTGKVLCRIFSEQCQQIDSPDHPLQVIY